MEDLSLHVLDVAENGISAGASLVKVIIEENLETDLLKIVIEDNGKGMSSEFLEKVLDPFVTTRTTRRVGLGLSLFQQSAEEADGCLNVESSLGNGTLVTVTMRHSHIDRKPMGDMASTILTLVEGNPQVDFMYYHRKDSREYLLDTRELRVELGEIPLNNPQVVSLIRDNLTEGLKELNLTVA
jgi:anti-sigma regulatory factor (Ser/Thr protein kinase)